MSILTPTKLETINYNQGGWDKIMNSNSQKLDVMLSNFRKMWDSSAKSEGQAIKWDGSAWVPINYLASILAPSALTDGSSIATDGSLSKVFTVTVEGDRTFENPTNLINGAEYFWVITQDSIGSRVCSFGTSFLFSSSPVLSTDPDCIDIVVGRAISGSLYCELIKNYRTSPVVVGYSVTYSGNENTSGTAPIDENVYESGDTVTVLGNTGTLAKTGYLFSCWNTESDGSGTDYAPDGTFSITSNVTLYAKWSVAVVWTPSDMSPSFWLDASSLSLNNNDPVSAWDDLGVDGFDVAAGNAAVFKTNVLNTNMPVVEFNGSNDYLTNGSFNNLNSVSAFSGFFVFKVNNTNDNQILFNPAAGAAGTQVYGSTFRTYVASGVSGYFVYTDTTFNIVGSIFDGSQADNSTRLKTRKNGGSEISLTFAGTIPASTSTANGVDVGRPYATNVAYFQGQIAEIVLFSTVLSTDDRQKVEGYLAHKWGLEANLPVGHPYKDAPP